MIIWYTLISRSASCVRGIFSTTEMIEITFRKEAMVGNKGYIMQHHLAVQNLNKRRHPNCSSIKLTGNEVTSILFKSWIENFEISSQNFNFEFGKVEVKFGLSLIVSPVAIIIVSWTQSPYDYMYILFQTMKSVYLLSLPYFQDIFSSNYTLFLKEG